MRPALEIWVDGGATRARIRLVGTLDRSTQTSMLAAIEDLLENGCRRLAVDVTDLYVADQEGAQALTEAQRMARDATSALTWRGVDEPRLRALGVAVRQLGYTPSFVSRSEPLHGRRPESDAPPPAQ